MQVRVTAFLLSGLILAVSACAGSTAYLAPEGVSASAMEADRRACVEESGIVRLREQQIDLEKQCMMVRGYTLKP